jgi:hypothetical protein
MRAILLPNGNLLIPAEAEDPDREHAQGSARSPRTMLHTGNGWRSPSRVRSGSGSYPPD